MKLTIESTHSRAGGLCYLKNELALSRNFRKNNGLIPKKSLPFERLKLFLDNVLIHYLVPSIVFAHTFPELGTDFTKA